LAQGFLKVTVNRLGEKLIGGDQREPVGHGVTPACRHNPAWRRTGIPRGDSPNGLARGKNESKKASFPANTLNDLFWF
jgi:hypothetical protein